MFYEQGLAIVLAGLTFVCGVSCFGLSLIFVLVLGLDGIKKSSIKILGNLFVLACVFGLGCFLGSKYCSQFMQERQAFYASQRETYLDEKEKIVKVSWDRVTLTVVTPKGDTRKFIIKDDNVLVDEGINRLDDLTGMYLYSSTTKGAFITPIIRKE